MAYAWEYFEVARGTRPGGIFSAADLCNFFFVCDTIDTRCATASINK